MPENEILQCILKGNQAVNYTGNPLKMLGSRYSGLFIFLKFDIFKAPEKFRCEKG
jgi:hypothetical protein